MWSCRPIRDRPETPAVWALAVIVVLSLSACGFRPLHLPREPEAATPAQRMAEVRVQPVRGRVGQMFHNLLRDRLNPSGQPDRPAYFLEVTLTREREGLGVRKDETATRANLTLRARFSLRGAEDRKLLLSGRARSVNSFNILDAFYATTVAEEDALRRGLRALADDIGLRLSVYFANPKTAGLP